MLRLGLTGGLASGKSTAARSFAALGVPVVDADAVYHGLLAPVAGAASPLVQRIVASFAGVGMADGRLDRQALGRAVFANAEARRRLEEIAHPAVAAAAEAAFVRLAKAAHPWALYDVPLLFERNLQGQLAGVVVVWVPRPVQLARSMARDGLAAAEVEARLGAQLPLDDKRARADFWLDNSGSPEALAAQVGQLRHRIDLWVQQRRAD